MEQHLLTYILLTPLAGLAVLLFIPGTSKSVVRIWANLVGIAGFLISLPLLSRFQKGVAAPRSTLVGVKPRRQHRAERVPLRLLTVRDRR